MRPFRQVPTSRLILRLGLKKYNVAAPLSEEFPRNVTSVAIPLHDHVGAPAKPLVSVGERVARGQCIANVEEDALGVPVHASISGVVTAVDEQLIFISAERG